jgi:tetratricopeptide (TPR) repeat protein
MYANFDQSMKLKKQIILICLIGAIHIPFNNLLSQNIQTKPTRQSSLEAFSQGNYEKAYAEFSELLLTYTKDPLYKYYSGVCLVKLNKDAVEAANLLKDAVREAGNIKTLPSDGLFYLGRAQQMSGKFSDAAESYKSYTDRVGKKVSKEMGVPELLQQCIQKKGQVADSEIKPSAMVNSNKPDMSVTAIKPITEEPAQSSAPKVITSKENVSADYEKILGEAVEFQSKADSVSAIVENQKKFISISTETEKSALKAKILQNEKIVASYQNSADQKYREAETLNHKLDSSMLINSPLRQTDTKVVKDTIRKVDNVLPKTVDRKPDTAKSIIPPPKRHVEVFSFFEVLAQPATDPGAKLIIDAEVPAGLIYRIQIAVFRNPVTPAFFKGLSPIYGFKLTGTDKTIYYAGMFRRSSDATKALATVKSKGFKDSFVVGLFGNKPVSADRSVMMEKEWVNIPFVSIENNLNGNKADTITPTLTFRVEVARSLKPLKEDILEGIRKAAGNRGLDIITLEDGKIDYLIGNFITFETAAEYSDLLKRNGYKDAQVVAWLGKKEIPVDTARQLFDKLK